MDRDAATVLAVDDEPLNLDLLEQELGDAGYRVLCARGGDEALRLAAAEPPELVLLDVLMPGVDGYETCRRLKASEMTRAIPVIFLSALSGTFDRVQAFSVGAVDYVHKPFEPAELLARVGVHVALRREIESHRRSKATIQLLIEGERVAADAIVGASPALQRLREQIALVAATDSTVLIQGETGTGKELVARAIHAQGARRSRPLIRVNCAALPRELVESELFGHEKGAFTGALHQRRGRFELADGGTLLLDEVGEMPLESQAKLLRVLQEREFERVGGCRSVRVDVRVMAATNRDLAAEVAAGRFRTDLFYRLNVFPILVPPLRERPEDVGPLIVHFCEQLTRRLGRSAQGVAPAFIERARCLGWPGNIRELENLVERALIVSRGGPLDGSDLLPSAAAEAISHGDQRGTQADVRLEAVEHAHIVRVLEMVGWRIEGEQGAAERLGMNASTLRGRMRTLGIRRRT